MLHSHLQQNSFTQESCLPAMNLHHIITVALRLLWVSIGLLWLNASLAAEGVPVSVAPVQQQTFFREVRLTGTVTSPSVAQLSAQTSGLVAEMFAEEGDRVVAGEVLMRMDSELAELQWQSARAKTRQASSRLKDAQRRFSEAERLGPQRGIAETQVRNLESEVAINEATLAQSKSDAEYQRALLDRQQLKAPFSGIVSRKLVEQGEWINPGDGVVELVSADNLRLDFSVAEDYLSRLHDQTSVQFSISALGNTSYSGKLDTIVPVADPQVRTFLLRILPTEFIAGMMPGMSVNATLNIPTSREGLVVLRDATLRQPDGRVIVWTAEQTDTGLVAVETSVQTGQAFAGQIEILSGLDADAQVIIRGNESLQNRQKIRIVQNNNVSINETEPGSGIE